MNNSTYEIRVHGRGGQGAVTAAALLARAIYLDGKYVQAFPSFGVERRGAPVAAFVRVSDKPIRLRSQIYSPDALIIQDHTLLSDIDVFQGVNKGSYAIVNTEKEKNDFNNIPVGIKFFTIPGTKIAIENIGLPIFNTVMLGAFAATNNIVKISSVKKVVLERFKGELGDKNIKALMVAFNFFKG